MVYFVGTPIGNLGEITYRAVETLKSVAAIFCEDTRHSKTLLDYYGINKPLYSYHKFNEKKSLDFVLSFCEKGEDVAVISDAGMPCINDPGNILVNALIAKGYPYTVVSGPNAALNAFIMSGYEPPFTYFGFLPEKKTERDKLLDCHVGVAVFYVHAWAIANAVLLRSLPKLTNAQRSATCPTKSTTARENSYW